ncbi:hypothetical protein Scep_022372 [Stephania cephalantha]|uniref:Uncharacterized protein n=1 Tax=Stephania cephalantha TaxID=152367 RepID=A0AAP0FAB3_9MAGN
MAVAAAAGSGVTTGRGATTGSGGGVSAAAATGSGMAATHALTAATAIGSDRAGQRRRFRRAEISSGCAVRQRRSAAGTIGSGGAAATTAAVASAVADRDEVLEKLWSKYFERISRGEGSGHDSLSVHSNNEEVKREKQEEGAIASPSSKHGNNGDITSAPTIMTMRERDEVLEKAVEQSVHSNNEEVKIKRQEEAAIAPPSSSKQRCSTSAPTITMRDRNEVLEKLWSKYFERISRGEGSGHDSLERKGEKREERESRQRGLKVAGDAEAADRKAGEEHTDSGSSGGSGAPPAAAAMQRG